MDPPTATPATPGLLPLLEAMLSPDPATVLAAEARLHSLDFRPSFLSDLFRVAASPPGPLPAAISLAAAIYLKNLVRRAWQTLLQSSPPPPGSPASAAGAESLLPEGDRAYVRAHLVAALAETPLPARLQLVEALKRVVAADFPLRFPFLVEHILHGLASPHPPRLHGALTALRALAKVYEFKTGSVAARAASAAPPAREGAPDGDGCDLAYLHEHPGAALNYLASLTFPPLLRLLRALDAGLPRLAPGGAQASESLELQRLIAKIFSSFTQYDLPSHLVADLAGPFSDWMELFLSILRRPVAAPAAPPDDADQTPAPHWKVKQRVAQIVYRIFQRYSNPSRLNPSLLRSYDVATLTAFGDFFRRNFAPAFTAAMLDILATDSAILSPRVANMALLFLETAVSIGITFKVIKPSLQPLITHLIFPYLCISDSDLALWDDDPGEYVRRTYNALEDFNTPRAAACSLLFVMVKIRRSTVMRPLMTFLIQVLDDYSSLQSPGGPPVPTSDMSPQIHAMPTTPDASRAMLARRKDGALLAIGTIREMLAVHPRAVEHLNLLMEQHVLHEFDSDIPFLRARACWLYGQFAASDTLYVRMLQRALGAIQRCLADKEFPVRVRAAVDIRHFVQNREAADAIAPYLGQLLNLLFSMLDDVDSTDIVATIDQLSVGFSVRIVPLAPELCTRLVDMFSRVATVGQGDDEASFAAVQCLQALSSIVTSVAVSGPPNGDKVELFAVIERSLAEVFDHMFDEDRIECFEDSLELLGMFVYHSADERGGLVQSIQAKGGVLSGVLDGGADGDMYGDEKVMAAMKGDVEQGGGVLSPYLWSLLPKALHAFQEWASDYSDHFLQLLDSYMTKAMRVLLTQQDGATSFAELILRMVSRMWDESCAEEDELVLQGSQFCGLFLKQCRRIGRRLEEQEVVVLTRLTMGRMMRGGRMSEEASTALIRSLAHLLYMAPVTVLMVIDGTAGGTLEVFKMWMGMVQQRQLWRWYDRKASAIALCAILGSDWMVLPAAVRQSIPDLVLAIVSLLESLATGGGGGGSGSSGGVHRWVDGGAVIDKDGSGQQQQSEVEVVDDADDVDIGSAAGTSGACLDKAEEEEEEEAGEVDDETEELGVLRVLDDVDELLLFESVVRTLPNSAWQQLGMALAKADTLRVESALHRAAEMRNVGDERRPAAMDGHVRHHGHGMETAGTAVGTTVGAAVGAAVHGGVHVS